MKRLFISLLILTIAHTSFALNKEELDKRIHDVTARLDEMQQKSDKCIPADTLKKAQGIILLERVKGGLVFGYESGHGVAMVRDAKTHKWSPAAFMASNASSFGLQAGGEQNFFVILLMNTNAARLMTEPNFDFGGEARGTAGNSHGGTESVITSAEQPVMIYSDRNGFYNGAVVKGGTLAPEENANNIYYGGEFHTMTDILFDKKVKQTPAAADLAAKLTQYSKPKKN